MQSKAVKIIIFVAAIAILGTLAFVGYNSYVSQKTQVPKPPFATSITPQPTQLPGEVISESDKTGAIELELNASTLEDPESDLKGLEEETSGL